MQPYWLDVVSGSENWQGLVAKGESDRIDGAWAIHQSRLRGGKAIVAPPLTPYTGIWLRPEPSLSSQKLIARNHALMDALEEQLPPHAIFEQKFHHAISDWLPFYWKGYRQQTRYTFLIEKGGLPSVEAELSDSFKRNLRAAERQFEVETTTDVSTLYRLIQEVFRIRGSVVPFREELLRRTYEMLSKRKQCAIYCAKSDGEVTSAIFVVWDQNTTYYLLGGRAGSNTKNSTNLLVWRAIEDAQSRDQGFDFEGSMIKGVHAFFRTFGAQMTPYQYVYRYNGLARLKYLRKSL